MTCMDQNYRNAWSFRDFRAPQQPNGLVDVYDPRYLLSTFTLLYDWCICNQVHANTRRKSQTLISCDKERLAVVLRLLAGDVNSCRNDLSTSTE
ncbi:hypothetical protein DKX38_026479 [Salix brachista]|uniref:Uncharacterized protein n=1 Tax=Salix brachista TaxID=2182728 RepID=A0A5N5J9T7_9ROSI|nr:hypothetical protein DKX38_026479 [Salix brachista]